METCLKKAQSIGMCREQGNETNLALENAHMYVGLRAMQQEAKREKRKIPDWGQTVIS